MVFVVSSISAMTQAVDEWERVADLIQQRELLLTRLEKFERLASDPNRFFEKGWHLSYLY